MRTPFSKGLAAFFLIALMELVAQTSIPVQQVRGSTSASGQVFLTLPNGSVNQALLDSAFAIDTSGPRPVLRIALPAAVKVVRVKVVAGADTPQSFTLNTPGATVANTLVYRNGLLQSEGDDYTYATATVTFRNTPGAAVQPGDIIQLVAIL